MNKVSWYKDWFNSPYYHLLYNNRNESEANFFIEKLCTCLELKDGAGVWDIACGKGRHALAFSLHGCKVIGTDLSENSIQEALTHKSENLDFFVHDMRRTFRLNYFNCAVNIFTSLGYFKNHRDNYTVFKVVHKALKPGGYFVVDFLNSEWIRKKIDPCGSKYCEQRDSVTFDITKTLDEKSIHKKISFNDKGKHFEFEETVSLLTKENFEDFAGSAGFKLENTFGDYALNPFDINTSERLILIFKK